MSLAQQIRSSTRAWARRRTSNHGSDQALVLVAKYIDWWNHRRLHGEIGMRTPAETEAAYYAQTASLTEAGTQ